jgi:alanine racemase
VSALAPSKVVVDLNAYSRNLAVIRGMIPRECKIMAVVKANGYGLGAVPLARRAVASGAAMLGVATVGEAMELREAGIEAPLLVLVQPPDEALSCAVEHDFRLMVSNVAVAERIGDLARRANRVTPVHCKIDTGMGRQGFSPDAVVAQMLHLTRVSHIDVEGIATHFAVANSVRDTFTANQLRVFRQVLRQIEKEGVPYEMVHAANSAAIVNHPGSHFDMVRPGLMTYGVWPTDAPPATSPLSQVVRWETQIVLIKELERGAGVGYGRTFTAEGPIRTAVIPVGYADGYPVALSNRGSVLIRGRKCPVRGAVSMDQTIIDITDVPGAAVGDSVTLIGSDSGVSITVEDLARWAVTIPYEILTGIGRRVERIYVDTP